MKAFFGVNKTGIRMLPFQLPDYSSSFAVEISSPCTPCGSGTYMGSIGENSWVLLNLVTEVQEVRETDGEGEV